MSVFSCTSPYILFATDFIVPVIYICYISPNIIVHPLFCYLLWSSSPFAPYYPLHRDLSRCFHLSGEIFELKAELNSDKKDRKKEAVKKVIASMTVGKDVR